MDSVLKFVYEYAGTYNIPNAIHPIIVNKIINIIDSKQCDYDHALAEVEKEGITFPFNIASLSVYLKKNKPESIININDIKENDIPVYPVEIRHTFSTLYEPSHFVIDGKDCTYSLIDTIPVKTLEQIRNGRIKLLIEYSHDPILDENWIKSFEHYIESINIDPNNVIVITGNYYKDLITKLKIVPMELLVTQQTATDFSMYPKHTNLGYESDIVREQDLNTNVIRNKRFLCFNRTMKHHRYALAYYVLKHRLLHGNMFSFLNDHGHSTDHIRNAILSLCDDADVNYYSSQIKRLIPYEIDTHHLPVTYKQQFDTSNMKKELFLDTYIHITSETSFDSEAIFFSEKTWKPIVNLQPFVYIGNYGALNRLRELGIKTFHPFIDESYDSETNHGLRLSMIKNELLKLNDKSIQEIHDWYYSITDVLIHNQKTFMSLKNINLYDKAFTDIINFTRDNT